MKAAEFAYLRPADLGEALSLLSDDAREIAVMSGGQSLLTLMNFRMARPELVLDIGGLGELGGLCHDAERIRIGAAVTHAEIEDAALPGPVGAFLSRVAAGIAFRAIRNRGTVGGSLAHADPSADWLTALAALGAGVRLRSLAATRELPVAELVLGAMVAALEPGEIIVEVLVPLSPDPLGWQKTVRKAGEFAEALAAARLGAEGAVCWIGGLAERPFAVEIPGDRGWIAAGTRLSGQPGFHALRARIEAAAPDATPHRQHLAAVAACDAVAQAMAQETTR